jgi:hypothetical protein
MDVEVLYEKINEHTRLFGPKHKPTEMVIPASEWIDFLKDLWGKLAKREDKPIDLDTPVFFDEVEVKPEHNGFIISGKLAAQIYAKERLSPFETFFVSVDIGPWKYPVNTPPSLKKD